MSDKGSGLLMAIDVGNTDTVIGLFDDGELVQHWRVQTEPERRADEYGVLVWSLFHAAGMEVPRVSDVVVACVVPPLTTVIDAMKQAPHDEQEAIRSRIVQLDFANAPILPFFEHLAGALAI